MQVKPLRDRLLDQILKQVHEESETHNPSLLRALTPAKLSSFSFENIISEWESHAPLFLKFSYAVANVHASMRKQKYTGVCIAGAVLLRERNVHMSAVHHIAGLILFHGNATKLVGHTYA